LFLFSKNANTFSEDDGEGLSNISSASRIYLSFQCILLFNNKNAKLIDEIIDFLYIKLFI